MYFPRALSAIPKVVRSTRAEIDRFDDEKSRDGQPNHRYLSVKSVTSCTAHEHDVQIPGTGTYARLECCYTRDDTARRKKKTVIAKYDIIARPADTKPKAPRLVEVGDIIDLQ